MRNPVLDYNLQDMLLPWHLQPHLILRSKSLFPSSTTENSAYSLAMQRACTAALLLLPQYSLLSLMA